MSAMNISSLCQFAFILQTSSSALESPARKALEDSAQSDFLWLLISTAFVAVGIVFEYPEVKHEFIEWLKARKEGPAPKNRVPLWSLIGFIIVTVGVAGEGVYEGLLGIHDTEIRKIDESALAADELQIAQVQKSNLSLKPRADKAEADLKVQEQRTAEAETRALIAQKEAESEKVERLKLEASVSPRRLTADEQRQIGSKCAYLKANNSPYRRVIVESYGMDVEGRALATQITSALVSGRLYIETRYGNTIQAGEFDTGVLISAAPEDEQFASCLADALTTIGHLTDVKVNPDRHVGGATMIGGAALVGGATMIGGGGQIRRGAPLPAGSQIDILVAIKPIEKMSADF